MSACVCVSATHLPIVLCLALWFFFYFLIDSCGRGSKNVCDAAAVHGCGDVQRAGEPILHWPINVRSSICSSCVRACVRACVCVHLTPAPSHSPQHTITVGLHIVCRALWSLVSIVTLESQRLKDSNGSFLPQPQMGVNPFLLFVVVCGCLWLFVVGCGWLWLVVVVSILLDCFWLVQVTHRTRSFMFALVVCGLAVDQGLRLCGATK